MSPLIRLAAALLIGAAIFFLGRLISSLLMRRNLSKIERAYLAREEERRKNPNYRNTLTQRLRDRAAYYGYDSTLGPIAAAAGLIFLLVAAALRFLGFGGVVALLISAPVTIVIGWLAVARGAARRRQMFDRQLLAALNLVADQLAAGFVPQRAFETVVATIDDPLHTEMGAALSVAATNRDIVGAMRDLAQRYPSRAFDLLLAALEINEQIGGRLEPSLRQASQILQSGFELAEEAKAEVSQAKAEFYGILITLGIITLGVYRANSAAVNEALSSLVGVLVLVGSFAWALFGVFIAQRLFNKAGERR